jgi:lysozyme
VRRLALLLLPLLCLIVGCGPNSSGPHPATTRAPVVTYLPPQSSVTPEGAKPEGPPFALPLVTLPVMHIDAAGVRLIGGFEGFGSCPYWDPYGRVWTRGFGETEGITAGSACISRSTGEARLRYLVESRYEWAIRALGVRFTQHEWDALCSFAWNLGAGIFQGSLRYDLQHRAFYSAASVMLLYDHAGGVVLEGLRTRRQAEVRLFLTPEPKPAPAKPSWRQLEHARAQLRADLTKHRCRVAPYHGRGRYHSLCVRWLHEGAVVNRELRA